MLKTLTRLRHAALRDLVSGVMMSVMLFGCAYLRKPVGPIPVKDVPAPHHGADRPLVVVLPGRGDDLDDLAKTGIAEAVQQAWPDADVLLAGVTLGYYADGGMARRLHDEVIVPARQRGYREIWLSGASMGGMGALLYERRYPHDVTGLVLYAPFMGDPSLIREILAAGGPASWNPGPLPASVDDDNYQRELWRLVKGWQDPVEGRRLWLVCGDADRFVGVARLIAALLPKDHYAEFGGGHEWTVWDQGALYAFARIAALPR